MNITLIIRKILPALRSRSSIIHATRRMLAELLVAHPAYQPHKAIKNPFQRPVVTHSDLTETSIAKISGANDPPIIKEGSRAQCIIAKLNKSGELAVEQRTGNVLAKIRRRRATPNTASIPAR
jgi:hypothetical protein